MECLRRMGNSAHRFLCALREWSGAITAVAALCALWQTSMALRQTSDVNAKTIAYYDEQMAPRFAILHDCPTAVTNDYCHRCIVRDIRVVNQGVPTSAINSASVRTFLHFAVFDKRPTSDKGHSSKPICLRTYYKDILYPLLTDGDLLKGEVDPIQYEIAAALRDYRKKHPDRFCEVIPRDLVDITYRDERDVQRTVWLFDGARSSSEEYKKILRLSREFVKSLNEAGKLTSWETVLDACYEESKREQGD